jgi:hypothetical protein
MRTITADLSISGALWDLKGKSGILENARYEADLRVQRATLSHFTAPDRHVCASRRTDWCSRRMPTRRRVFPLGQDNRPVPELVLVAIDIGNVTSGY